MGKNAHEERNVGRMIRVLLVDDHKILRDGLKALLEATDDVQVVATASHAEEALEQLRHEPDLVLLDISLPDKDGIWLAKQIRARKPNLPLLVLSMHADEKTVLKAIEAGVNGYTSKTIEGPELHRAIRTLVEGGSYLQNAVAPFVFNALRPQEPDESDSSLTRRELQVLEALSRGQSNREIAESLHVSVSTVKAILRATYSKLEVSGRTEAVAVALQRGLVSD